MAVSWSSDNDSEHRLTLRREARFPMHRGHRSCWMVGALMAAIVVSTYLDSVAWQRRVEQVEQRAHVQAVEAKAARLEHQIRDMEQEIEELRQRLCASEDSAARLRGYLLSPVSPDDPMPRAMAPTPCSFLTERPAEWFSRGPIHHRDLR